jgi:hypothetical protein
MGMLPLDTVWTFGRGDELLQLRRVKTEEGFCLVEHDPGLPERSFFFADLQPLARFEKELITHLQATGWTLAGFWPERRSGTERRRHSARSGPDRRGLFWPRSA